MLWINTTRSHTALQSGLPGTLALRLLTSVNFFRDQDCCLINHRFGIDHRSADAFVLSRLAAPGLYDATWKTHPGLLIVMLS
jgi:hypothetical protein